MDSITIEDHKKNFFKAVLDGNINQIRNFYENQNILPWEFFDEDGYSGK